MSGFNHAKETHLPTDLVLGETSLLRGRGISRFGELGIVVRQFLTHIFISEGDILAFAEVLAYSLGLESGGGGLFEGSHFVRVGENDSDCQKAENGLESSLKAFREGAAI